MSSNNTLFADIWFSVVKKMEDFSVDRVNYCRPVNTGHKRFLWLCCKN